MTMENISVHIDFSTERPFRHAYISHDPFAYTVFFYYNVSRLPATPIKNTVFHIAHPNTILTTLGLEADLFMPRLNSEKAIRRKKRAACKLH